MRILGIESSCDETSVALIDTAVGVVCNEVLSQIELHSAFGGVVPGVAAREHLYGFSLILEKLAKAGHLDNLSYIAVANGPGLAGCLSIGVSYAKSLGLILNKDVYAVNHLHGHILSVFLDSYFFSTDFNLCKFLPHIGLLVSGGNTVLCEVYEKDGAINFNVLAQTQDDAVGEAIDKGARLLGLNYPGGPIIEEKAKTGNPSAIKFPVAIKDKNDERFSFSGLKTSLRYFLEKKQSSWIEEHISDICASYQNAAFKQLEQKTYNIAKHKKFSSIGISGGVANNAKLRNIFENLAKKLNIKFLCPEKKYCGDNAAMIAFAAMLNSKNNEINVNPIKLRNGFL